MDLKTFLENFDAIAEAPGGIPKLRSLILDLAVRGKLVPQNLSENKNFYPLNVDSSRIERKTKYAQKNEQIQDNIPYEIPKNWEWKRFGELVLDCFTGLERSKAEQSLTKQFPYFKMNNISSLGACDLSKITKVEATIDEVKRYRLRNRDFLFNTRNSYELVGKTCVFRNGASDTEEMYLFNNNILKVAFPDSVTPEFINLWFTSPIGKAILNELKSATTNVAAIYQGKLMTFVTPLPPTEEQKRIVEKVDELMALCDRLSSAKQTRDNLRQKLRGSAIASLMNAETDEELDAAWAFVRDNWQNLSQHPEDVDSLRRSILQLAVQGKLTVQEPTDQSASLLASQIKEKKNYFTKSKPSKKPDDIPFEIPANWVWLRIDDFYDVSGGIQKTPKRTPVSNYFPYLRVANVQRGYLDLEEIEYFELLEGELERWSLQPGDLLIVEGNGSSKEIGRCAIWNGQIEKCVHQNHIIRVRPIGHEGQLFTLMFLNSPSGMTEMRNLAITTSGLYSLSVGKIREILVPLPPFAEQKRIVAKVDELMKLCDQLEASLRQSQQRAESLAASAISHLII